MWHSLSQTMSDQAAARSRIEFISEPASVNMADDWFDIATLYHFWIRRRFDVARKILRGRDLTRSRVAEVGCGNGLVQRQFEEVFGVAVDGFDLNVSSLEHNVSTAGRLIHYNVLEKRREFGGCYDLVVLFDVLEHNEDQESFLEAVTFLVRKGGRIIINVPALQQLYSDYDRCAGHLRRYSLADLGELITRQGLQVRGSTYWGLPLLPSLVLRQQYLKFVQSDFVIKRGFDPGNKFVSQAMYLLSCVEPIPQQLCGTSVMLLAERVA